MKTYNSQLFVVVSEKCGENRPIGLVFDSEEDANKAAWAGKVEAMIFSTEKQAHYVRIGDMIYYVHIYAHDMAQSNKGPHGGFPVEIKDANNMFSVPSLI